MKNESYLSASSFSNLLQDRLLMELNYMLSYGAAKPSLCLLHKFNVLEIFFPIHVNEVSATILHSIGSDLSMVRLTPNKLPGCRLPILVNWIVGDLSGIPQC